MDRINIVVVLCFILGEGWAMDPSWQMYPAVVHPTKMGVGVNPIHRHYFVVDQDFSGVLLPPSYKATSELTLGKECTRLRGQKEYLDLGGPKPFFISGCSPYQEVGVLGLGENSTLWGVFDGYQNRGGRVHLLSKAAPHTTDAQPLTTLVSEVAPLKESSYVYDARSKALVMVQSYSMRGSMPRAVSTLAIFYLYSFLRSKVSRRLVYIWRESVLSIAFRSLFGIFLIVATPVLLEFYGARQLLREDLGFTRMVLISLYTYYATGLVLVYLALRVLLFHMTGIQNAVWAARVELLGNVAVTASSLMGAWFSLLSKAPADSGAFISSSLLMVMYYEITVLLLISLVRLASGSAGDPIWWSVLWWMWVILPVWLATVWISSSFGVWTFLWDRVVVSQFYVTSVGYVTMLFIAFLATSHVQYGVKVVGDKLLAKKKH